MTGQTMGAPGPSVPVVPLIGFSQTAGDTITSAGGYWMPVNGAWQQDGPVSIATVSLLPSLFQISSADLAVQGLPAPKIRTRLTLFTNGVAPGIEVRARLHDVLFAGGSGAFTVNANTQFDVASITSPAASARSTVVTAGVALPADGFYVVDMWFSSGPAVGSRFLFRCDVEAFYS